MPGGGIYSRIIKSVKRDLDTISRIRARPTWTTGKMPTAEEMAGGKPGEYKGRYPPVGRGDSNLYIKPKKPKVLGAGPIKGRGGGTIAYPENQDNVRNKPPRGTIKYPSQERITRRRPPRKGGITAPPPAKTGSGGMVRYPRVEEAYERETR